MTTAEKIERLQNLNTAISNKKEIINQLEVESIVALCNSEYRDDISFGINISEHVIEHYKEIAFALLVDIAEDLFSK